MKNKIILLFALMLTILIAIEAKGSEKIDNSEDLYAFLYVYVSDSITGEPLIGMTVNVGSYTGITASFGLIIFAIPAGTYNYEVEGNCDYYSKSGNVTLAFGQTVTLYVKLLPANQEPPENFTANSVEDFVLCTWEPPDISGPSHSFLGYNLYWDEYLLNSSYIIDTFYLIYPQFPCDYNACIEAIYTPNYEDTCYSEQICDTVHFSLYSNIEGTVVDFFTTYPIEGAIVTIGNHMDTTNSIGEFEVENIPFGTYILSVSADTYVNFTNENFEVDTILIQQNIELIPILPPQNLTGDHFGSYNYLSWSPPFAGEGWIHWDNGINTGNSIGLTDGGTFYVASHWNPMDLTDFDDMFITKVAFYPCNDINASYSIKIWTGANATNLVYEQDVINFNVDEWNEIALNESVQIDVNNELWFGYSVTHEAGIFPVGTDDGPAIQYNGDMISFDGSIWESMAASYNLDYNFNLKAFVSFLPNNCKTQKKHNFAKNFLGYNIYRSVLFDPFDKINMEPVTDTTYIDNDILPYPTWYYYEYYVTAVYDEGESDPSNIFTLLIIGTDKYQNEDDYFSIYPNPADDLINIKFNSVIEGHILIELLDISGQKVYQWETVQANSENLTVNVESIQPAIYFLKINSSDFNTIRKIIIR
ncbi:MAG: carboxypeptidase regulatory-like domain-containing protein [Bacteroidales bacterium]|nr:carboxypeptidase regulatory-like domain-containing protein [Bacteroidales bacterium]